MIPKCSGKISIASNEVRTVRSSPFDEDLSVASPGRVSMTLFDEGSGVARKAGVELSQVVVDIER